MKGVFACLDSLGAWILPRLALLSYYKPVIVAVLVLPVLIGAVSAGEEGGICWVCGCSLFWTHGLKRPFGCQYYFADPDCYIHYGYNCTPLEP